MALAPGSFCLHPASLQQSRLNLEYLKMLIYYNSKPSVDAKDSDYIFNPATLR